jgi:hypothetical protein
MKKNKEKIYSDFFRINKQLSNKLSFFESDDYDIDVAIQMVEEISNILRKMIDGAGGLLKQLGYHDYYVFPNYQTSEMGSNLVGEHKLVSMFFSNRTSGFKSHTEIDAQWFSNLHFWWNEIVINDKDNVLVTRRDIVKVVADKEGGAHYDPEYSYEYYKMCIKNNTNIKSEEIVYKNIYFCSLITIAQEYLCAMNLLSRIQRSKLVSEIQEDNTILLLREYPKTNKFPRYQLNILDESMYCATRILLTLEKKFMCNHYIYGSYLQIYIDNFSNEHYQYRVFKNEQSNTELYYIIDVNKCIRAVGKMTDTNKFILFNDSTIAKLHSGRSREFLSKGIISEEAYCYRVLTNIEFAKKQDAFKFIAGRYRGELKWGDLNLYDPAKSIVMLDKVSSVINSLNKNVAELYEEVKALSQKCGYIFGVNITNFDKNSNFIASHKLDRRSKSVCITINEEKVNDVIVSKSLLFIKLQIEGLPSILVKESSERMYVHFAGEIETFLQSIIIRRIQDLELCINRKSEVKNYSISILNNSIDINENLEHKYSALFKVLEFINITRNYEQYYGEAEKYGEIFQAANSIFGRISEEHLMDSIYYREIVIYLFNVLEVMLKNDGFSETNFKTNVAIEYPIAQNELEKNMSDIFDFEHEGNLLILYAKKDNQAAYYLTGSTLEDIKNLSIREFYGVSSY